MTHTLNRYIQPSTLQVMADALNTLAQSRYDRESYRDAQYTRVDALRWAASECGFVCIADDHEQCEIWNRAGVLLNLWTEGVDNQEIAPAGLGFDTYIEWYRMGYCARVSNSAND